MTMHLYPATHTLRPGHSHARTSRLRAGAGAIRRTATRTIEATGRLYHAFVVNLMRRQMRRALHSLSDHLLARVGIRRSEIEAHVAALFPHRGQPAP